MTLPTFVEERMPTDITYGSSGGPVFSTSVFASASGAEQRNSLWAESRNKYDIAYGIRDKTDMDVVLNFFYNVRGRAIGFRFKDWADYHVISQTIGTGNGTQSAFQIIKTYTSGSYTYTRNIYKPVSGTLSGVTVNAVAMTEGVDFTVDYTTGIITFTTPPGSTHAVVVGAVEFDVPVRFDTDELPIVHEAFIQESLSSIPLVELRMS